MTRCNWMSTILSSWLGVQAVEDDDLVDAVEELGRKNSFKDSRTMASRCSGLLMSWMALLPMLLVMMMTVFLKSTVRPWPSVMRPSSST